LSLAADRLPTRIGTSPASRLPVWPVVTLFGLFPVWWVLGLVDVIWVPIAVVMALYLQRAGALRAPRVFILWLLFLLVALFSIVMISGGGDLIGFVYRYSLYVSSTVLFLYVYNARQTLNERFVAGVLTCWWLTTVVGGYLGVLLPSTVIRTPVAYLLSDNLVANDLVNHMVIRRFAQYNANSYFSIPPRPSAPFLYTNNWGNVFSLLLPFVVVYLIHVRRERRFWPLVVMLPLSAVPAVLTLNRGMFLGIAIAMVYVAFRLALRRNFVGIAALAVVCGIGVIALQVFPIQEKLDSRLNGETNSNTDRTSLAGQALALVPFSPVFGYGGPQASPDPKQAPVGTQGQVWLLLVSHGPIATAGFIGFFLLTFRRVRRRHDPMGIACATVVLVGTIELLYYGAIPNGLPLMMVAAAVGLREGKARRR
jgi:hypothetical protein